MAKLPKIFSTEDQPELGSFEAIPRGKYVAQIIDSEMKETNAGDGQYLELQYQILEGEYRGRSVWSRLNLDNPSPMAVEIAYKHLTSLCKAIGVKDLGDDSAPLHGKPLIIRVSVTPATAQYEANNDVKGYEPYTGATPEPIEQAEAPPPSAKAAASVEKKKMPWEK